MDTHEWLTIVAVTLAVITAYSFARDLTDESATANTPQLALQLAPAHAKLPRPLLPHP
ncbi:hypothetical protein ACS7SF_21560 (plasmid) [Ralstonia sp. 25C]|uniref:hypothetical protein n=1 Tax=Ralstonia sp. 25C TaxID=3447363 RepID=UPI003F756D17